MHDICIQPEEIAWTNNARRNYAVFCKIYSHNIFYLEALYFKMIIKANLHLHHYLWDMCTYIVHYWTERTLDISVYMSSFVLFILLLSLLWISVISHIRETMGLLCKQIKAFVCLHLLREDCPQVGSNKLLQLLHYRLEGVVDHIKPLLVLANICCLEANTQNNCSNCNLSFIH